MQRNYTKADAALRDIALRHLTAAVKEACVRAPQVDPTLPPASFGHMAYAYIARLAATTFAVNLACNGLSGAAIKKARTDFVNATREAFNAGLEA